jgi:hypothetical protein
VDIPQVSKNTFYQLSYDANTDTGEISNILFDGNAVALTGAPFTDANTTYAVFMANGGQNARGNGDDFAVSTVPEPAAMALLGLSGGLLTVRRRTRA